MVQVYLGNVDGCPWKALWDVAKATPAELQNAAQLGNPIGYFMPEPGKVGEWIWPGPDMPTTPIASHPAISNEDPSVKKMSFNGGIEWFPGWLKVPAAATQASAPRVNEPQGILQKMAREAWVGDTHTLQSVTLAVCLGTAAFFMFTTPRQRKGLFG
jgi:hypothetical protein